MTLQQKIQLIKQRLGDVAPPKKSAPNITLWATVGSAGLVLAMVPTVLSLYFLYRINKNTKRAR